MYRCCWVEHFNISLVSANPNVWCGDVCSIAWCNWQMGSLYVGLQAEIMTPSWKWGLGYNGVSNAISGRSLRRTWKASGLLLRPIHSLTQCFCPLPPTHDSCTKTKKGRIHKGDCQPNFGLPWTMWGNGPSYFFMATANGPRLWCSNYNHWVQGCVKEPRLG